ncbi:MAG: hypothetical protein ACRDIU_05755, partial [Actinomycetota bacterium]
MKRFSRVVPAVLAVAFVGVSAYAWACTGQSYITPLVRNRPATERNTTQVQAVALGKVGVEGRSTASGPVSVRWNTANGPILATVTVNGDQMFSASVTVPQASPGVYYLILTSGTSRLAGTAIQIVEPGSAAKTAVSDGLWSGFSSDGPAADTVEAAAPKASPTAAAGVALLATGVTVGLSG